MIKLTIIQMSFCGMGDQYSDYFFIAQESVEAKDEARQDNQECSFSLKQQRRQTLNERNQERNEELAQNDDWSQDRIYDQDKWRRFQQCLLDQINAERSLLQGFNVFEQFSAQLQMRAEDAWGEEAIVAERQKDLQLHRRLKQFQEQGEMQEQFWKFSQQKGLFWYSNEQRQQQKAQRRFRLLYEENLWLHRHYSILNTNTNYKQDSRRRWVAIERGRPIWRKFQMLRRQLGMPQMHNNEYQRIYQDLSRESRLDEL